PYRTQHYTLYTDVEPELAQDLSQRLDRMYEEYARRLADFRTTGPAVQLNVYVFADRDDYAHFTGNRVPSSVGIFMPARNLLAAYLEGNTRDELRKTLQHEAFH